MLLDRLSDYIQAQPQQRIPFATYMDWVLYDEAAGYYSNRSPIGPQGDFITSPSLSSDFGELLAVQLVELWQTLGQPQPFDLLEMGAGQGLLAIDILSFLQQQHPDCFAAIRYSIVEKASGMRRSQQARLSNASLDHPGLADRVQWTDWSQIAPESLTGCCFSNELVDALPVHLVEWRSGQLQEVFVAIAPQKEATQAPQQTHFCEVLGPLSTPALSQYFQALNLDLQSYPDGYRTEVNLAAQDWLTTVASKLQRGYLLTIDYGHSADRYYHPARTQGTLQCYRQHRHHNDPYYAPGEQDLTAHVNFTALEHWGTDLGLTRLGLTQQALFLMALGLGDRLTALATEARDIASIQQAIQRRDSLHRLLDPSGLGGFWILLQGKNAGPMQPLLRGFMAPIREL
jgi:SAM-dependent MidA family methyltransferase